MSFRDKTEFNMLTGDVRRHKNHVTEVGGVEVLRAAAIYGANGSGKSNLVKALHVFMGLFQQDRTLLNCKYCKNNYWYKLDNEGINKPTCFSIELFIEDVFYEFGLEFKKSVMTREWLSIINPQNPNLNTWLYTRITSEEGKTDLKVNSELYSDEKDVLKIEFIQNELGVPSKLILPSLKGKGFADIDKFINAPKIVVNDGSLGGNLQRGKLVNLFHILPYALKSANEVIALADIGIKKVGILEFSIKDYLGINDIAQIPAIEEKINERGFYDMSKDGNWAIAVKQKDKIKVKSLMFYHSKREGDLVEFSPSNESEGTLTTLALLFSLVLARVYGGPIIIDEIEKSIHPLLIKELLKKFMAQDEVKGQLIFTTHNSDLLDLDIFRQDEIWFTEKSKEGATSIYPLTEYNPRADLDIRKGYLTGRFGAIPFLGRLDDLNWNKPELQTK